MKLSFLSFLSLRAGNPRAPAPEPTCWNAKKLRCRSCPTSNSGADRCQQRALGQRRVRPRRMMSALEAMLTPRPRAPASAPATEDFSLFKSTHLCANEKQSNLSGIPVSMVRLMFPVSWRPGLFFGVLGGINLILQRILVVKPVCNW